MGMTLNVESGTAAQRQGFHHLLLGAGRAPQGDTEDTQYRWQIAK
jgi:hypothetical protein